MMTNKQERQRLVLVTDEFDTVNSIVSEVFGSASIRDFKISGHGKQFTIIVTDQYYVPEICLKQLESRGYFLQTLHGGKQGLEITIGGIRK